MQDIGIRLRTERNRLGYNQTEFGALGSVCKQAQVKYEKGVHFPGADYLQAIAKVGADVQFIVTGEAGNIGAPMSPDEAMWLDYFRSSPGVVQASVMGLLRAAVAYVRSEQVSRYKLPAQPKSTDGDSQN